MSILLGILNTLAIVISLFLVCVVLIQRGRGGGLAGAFGGVGGSSAFGTKAGDVFTRITIAVAGAWMVVLMLLVVLTNGAHQSAYTDEPTTSETKAIAPGGKAKTNASGADTSDAAGAALPSPPIDALAPPPPPSSPSSSAPKSDANAKAPSSTSADTRPAAPSAPVKAPAIPEKK